MLTGSPVHADDDCPASGFCAMPAAYIHPDRFRGCVPDLPAPLARKAKTFGVTFSLDSDAHRTGDLAAIEFAVGQARRAGLVKDDVLNARPLEDVLAFVSRKRAPA